MTPRLHCLYIHVYIHMKAPPPSYTCTYTYTYAYAYTRNDNTFTAASAVLRVANLSVIHIPLTKPYIIHIPRHLRFCWLRPAGFAGRVVTSKSLRNQQKPYISAVWQIYTSKSSRNQQKPYKSLRFCGSQPALCGFAGRNQQNLFYIYL